MPADNLNRRIAELEQATKYAEAIPLAERYVEAVGVQHGPDPSEAAVALNQLARLLQASSRFAEAEPLYRRALAIAEQRVGLDLSSRTPTARSAFGLHPMP